MAKTIQDIVNDMDTAQIAEVDLIALNSPSGSAVYTVWKRVVAYAHHFLYQAWDETVKIISQVSSQQIIGTKQFYVGLALNYNAQRASCLEVGTKVILKVAKVVSGSTTQLTNTELTNLKNHINARKVVGTDIDVISQTADLVSLVMSIQYIGTQLTVETAVKAAVKAHLNSLSFDANLSKSLLENAILSVPGVLDASVDTLSVDYGAGYIVIPGNLASPDAGYYEVGKLGGNDLITLNMYL